jgi:hypothetical protein
MFISPAKVDPGGSAMFRSAAVLTATTPAAARAVGGLASNPSPTVL